MRTLRLATGALALVGALILVPYDLLALSCKWDNTSNDWGASTSHWDCGAIPGVADSVTIDGGTVTLSTSHSIKDLALTGGTIDGAGNLDISGTFAWSGGAMAGTGTTTVGASGALTISAGVAVQRQITVNGTGSWTAGRLDFSTAGVITNNGAFTTTADNGCENFGGANAFNNSGTFTKSTATGSSYVNVPFNNTGTVTISSGTVNLNGGGTSTGSFVAGSGATLNFANGTHAVTLAAGKSVSGTGTMGFTGGTTTIGGAGTYSVTGTNNITNGTVNMNIASGVGDWTQSAGNLAGSSTVTVPSGKSYSWSGGTMSGAGSTVIASGASLTISAGVAVQRQITVNGTGSWTAGRIDFSTAGVITNNGAFTTTADNGCEDFGGANAFNNVGTFAKSTATGSSYINVPFNNTGTTTINSGTMNLNGGGTSTGSFVAGATGTLNFGAATQVVTLAAGKGFSGLGTMGFTGGTTTIGGAGTYNVTGTSNITLGTVNLNIASGAGAWTQSAGNLAGTATVTVPSGKSYSWSGGTMSGTGSTVIAAGATLTISAGVAVQRPITVNGTGSWTAGRIDFSTAGVIANNGAFTTTADNGCEDFGGTNAFNNAGTFTKMTATGSSYINVPFNNTGTMTINSGTMNLNGGGTSTGSFVAGATGTLNFGAATHAVTLAAGKSVSGAGTMGFTGGTTTIGGAGTYSVTGTSNITLGTVNLNIASGAGAWTQSAGNLAGTATVTVPSGKSYSWSGGTMSGTGSTVIAAGATLTISAGVAVQRPITVNGTGSWTAGRIDFSTAGVIANNGAFTTTADNGCEDFGGTNAFNNAGTFTKMTATGSSYINVPFNNTGTMTINSGTMNLNGGGTSTGSFVAGATGTLNFGAATHAVTLAAGKSVSGAGTMGFTGGTTTIGGAGTYSVTGTSNITLGTVNLNIASGAGAWTQSAGNLAGTATVTVPSGKSYSWSGGTMSGTGSTVIAAGATLTISAGVAVQRPITVNGTGSWTAGRIDFSTAGVIANNGAFTTTADNGCENFGSANAFNNAGTFTKSTATGVSYFNVPFNNTGTINANSGTLNFTGVFTQTSGFTILNGGNVSTSSALNIQGGTLKGNGTITGGVFNGGTVAPGLSPGTLTITGNYSQTAAGTLAVEINGLTAGTQYDQLVVNGTVVLAGSLAVTSGFTPSAGDGFAIIVNDASDGITGDFTGLPESAVVTALPAKYRITYAGETGNDVLLEAGPAASAQLLVVDAASGAGSDGDGIFEPGETVTIKPTWKNQGTDPITLTGAGSDFAGASGATYTIADGAAVYGTIAVNASASCGSNCYSLFVTDPAARPVTHWDAKFTETPSTLADPPKVWTLHLGDSFTDVPRSQTFYKRIETLVHNGITAGCNVGKYCPDDAVSRSQMAIFIGKGLAGGGPNVPASGTVNGNPYNCVSGAAGVSLFTDVAPTDIFCKHVHYMAVQNITTGCNVGLYCPTTNLTRGDMAIFVAKALAAPAGGPGVPITYGPDPGTGLSYSCAAGSPNLHFTDIGTSDSFCKHVHFLWAKGIITGCSATTYCPTDGVTRDAMAKFLGNAFHLVLYGP